MAPLAYGSAEVTRSCATFLGDAEKPGFYQMDPESPLRAGN